MYGKMGWKDLKRNMFMNGIIILLLMVILLITVSVVSVIELRFKKYITLSDILKENGRWYSVDFIQHPNKNIFLRRSKEVEDVIADAKEVISMSMIFVPFNGNTEFNAWCYDDAIIKRCVPLMEEGRWFRSSDYEESIVKAVISYNNGKYQVGDVFELKTYMSPARQEIEIIGVMEDYASVYGVDKFSPSKGDFRDCYYTYSYDKEGLKPLIILANEQIKNFPNFNTEHPDFKEGEHGFQLRITGPMIITYEENMEIEVINANTEALLKNSHVSDRTSLKDMRAGSIRYILYELNKLLPVILSALLLTMLAAISAGAITVKKQLKNYAIYYICGMTWKQCSRISLVSAGIAALISLSMISCSLVICQRMGLLKDTALHLGAWQITSCVILLGFYLLFVTALPMQIVRKTSANIVLKQNT